MKFIVLAILFALLATASAQVSIDCTISCGKFYYCLFKGAFKGDNTGCTSPSGCICDKFAKLDDEEESELPLLTLPIFRRRSSSVRTNEEESDKVDWSKVKDWVVKNAPAIKRASERVWKAYKGEALSDLTVPFPRPSFPRPSFPRPSIPLPRPFPIRFDDDEEESELSLWKPSPTFPRPFPIRFDDDEEESELSLWRPSPTFPRPPVPIRFDDEEEESDKVDWSKVKDWVVKNAPAIKRASERVWKAYKGESLSDLTVPSPRPITRPIPRPIPIEFDDEEESELSLWKPSPTFPRPLPIRFDDEEESELSLWRPSPTFPRPRFPVRLDEEEEY